MRKRTAVVLGPFSSEPFARGLRTLLMESGELEVVLVDDLNAASRDGTLAGASMLITEGTDPIACRTYLVDAVVRSVVLFDPVGARAFIGVDNPDWKQLAQIVRSVLGEVLSNPEVATSDQVRLIDPGRLLVASAHGADSGVLAPIVEWLELSLGLCLAQRPGHDHRGVPGWSVAPSEALEQLNLGPSSTDEAHLADRLAFADNALFVTRQSLPRALGQLAEVFSLSNLELRLLCLVLAPEIDGRYATVIGVLQDDLTRRRPGLTLLAELMSQNDVDTWNLRRTVNAYHSVVAQGLLRPAEYNGLPVDVGFEPSRAVLAHLLASSVEQAAADLEAVLRPAAPELEPALSAEEAELARLLRLSIAESPAVIQLVGGNRSKRWFGRLAASIGLSLVIGDLGMAEPSARASAVTDWLVLGGLNGSGVLVLGVEKLDALDRRRVADQLSRSCSGVRLVATDAAFPADGPVLPALVLRAPTIATTQRADWWSIAAANAGLPLAPCDTERLAATVTIDPDQIDLSLALAARRKAAAKTSSSIVELVQRAARDLVPTQAPPGVRRIEPIYGWDDIVLPDDGERLLRAIPMHVLQSGRVLEQWGFASRMPYGQGVAALFSGPSGTGKTMAAQIIARELGVDLLQVDLSKTVSKYIGETEKNLDRAFEAAELTGGVLLFDEADAIFGKRTEIKDAHDRHANVEVAYLLQRIESFYGLAILTTNLKQNIDAAFVRRLRFVIDFALPNAAQRELIWRKAFPSGAPLASEVDVAFLASRLQLPGGSIQNIALQAAFLAAADEASIDSDHLLAATRRELLKIGMLNAERSLDEWRFDTSPTPRRRVAS